MRITYLLILIITLSNVYAQETMPINGVQPNFSPVYAFTNAHLIISGEESIKQGTLLIQGDRILEIGASVIIPEGSIIKNLDGDYIYPSFIDLFSDYGMPTIQEKSWNPRPQYNSNKEKLLGRIISFNSCKLLLFIEYPLSGIEIHVPSSIDAITLKTVIPLFSVVESWSVVTWTV